MALPASDVFTGTNGTDLATYSANWTAILGVMVIQSNGAGPDAPGAADEIGYAWTADAFGNDHYSQATVQAVAAGSGSGVCVRAQETNNYYGFTFYDVTTELSRVVNGVFTAFGTGSAVAANDVVRLSVFGSTLTATKNGETAGCPASVTNSAIPSGGSAGVCGWGDSPTANRVDGWSADNVTLALVSSNYLDAEAVTSAATTSLAAAAVGDLITVVLPINSGVAPSSVSSNLDGAFTTECNYSFNFRVMIYRLVVATAGVHTVTVNYSSADDIQAFVDVWRGLATTGLPDAETSGTNGTSTSVAHGTLAISARGVILTCARIGGGATTITAASGFTAANLAVRAIRQYKITAGSETPTNTCTTDASVSYDGIAVAFIVSATVSSLVDDARGPFRGMLRGAQRRMAA
jgi:hypothetical protein